MGEVIVDRLFTVVNAAKDSVADAVARDVAKPAFDHIQPRTACRDEVLVPLQPALNVRMFVRGIVVDNQMQIPIRWSFSVNLLQKPNLFLMAVLLHTFGDNLSFGKVDRCEQCRRAVAFVIECLCLQSAGKHGQTLLRAVQCLNLTLFVARKKKHMLRWVQIQTDNIDQLLNKLRVAGHLECFDRLAASIRFSGPILSSRILPSLLITCDYAIARTTESMN